MAPPPRRCATTLPFQGREKESAALRSGLDLLDALHLGDEMAEQVLDAVLEGGG